MAKEEIARPAIFGVVIEGPEDTVFADANLTEEWSSEVTVTEHPLEDGSVFADHAQLQPVELSYTLHLTDSPITGENQRGRGMSAFSALEAMRDAREPVVVFAERRAFDGMLITSLNRQFPDPPEAAVTCAIRLRQVRFVAPERVTLEAVEEESRDRAAETQDRGSQPTAEMTEEEGKAALEVAENMPRTLLDVAATNVLDLADLGL